MRSDTLLIVPVSWSTPAPSECVNIPQWPIKHSLSMSKCRNRGNSRRLSFMKLLTCIVMSCKKMSMYAKELAPLLKSLAFSSSGGQLPIGLKGNRVLWNFSEDHQKLTCAEEGVLENFIIESAECGFPMTLGQIEEYANLILQNRQGPNY